MGWVGASSLDAMFSASLYARSVSSAAFFLASPPLNSAR